MVNDNYVASIAMWTVFFVAGVVVTSLAYLLKRKISRVTIMAVLSWSLGILGFVLLLCGGVMEYLKESPGGIVLAATGTAFLAATGIGATVTAKWENEDMIEGQKQKKQK